MRPLILGLGLAALAACTSFPELDDTAARPQWGAAYPVLGPLDQALAQADRTGISPDLSADVAARVAALRARAARLAGPVIDRDTRRRMAGGIR